MRLEDHRSEHTAAHVATRVAFDPKFAPRIILAVSPCRSGSTVLLRAFGGIGVESHFQQLKNLLRWSLLGQDQSWTIPSSAGPDLLMKETIGPFTEAECAFNPLQVMLDVGFPTEKLHVVTLGRAPLITWASWYGFWPDRAPMANMIKAFVTTNQIQEQARVLGIASTCLVFEAFRDNAPEAVFRSLFQRLGLVYSPLAIQGWDASPGFGAPGSNIVLPVEPDRFITPGIHDRVKNASQFAYTANERALSDIKPTDRDAIVSSRLPAIYESWRKKSVENLQLNINGA